MGFAKSVPWVLIVQVLSSVAEVSPFQNPCISPHLLSCPWATVPPPDADIAEHCGHGSSSFEVMESTSCT